LKILIKILDTIFSPIVTIFVGLFTIFWAFFVLVLVFTGLSSTVDFFLRIWARIINFLARIDLKVEGVENIPKEGCLLVFNHLSLFDIPIVQATINKRIRFGAKKELFFIPIFGQAMKIVGVLKIDRGDRADAIATLKTATSRIRKGESFILAAEGTRFHENRLGDFKSGPFILSIEAQCPLIPVVIWGAYNVLPKKHLFFSLAKPHIVRIQFLPPVSTAGYHVNQRQDLKKVVREQMSKSFEYLKSLD
jgi:1-acyl-sn-glycerol-3-phosphate acyltransferase